MSTFYRTFFRRLLFNLDPEASHHLMLYLGQVAGCWPITPVLQGLYSLNHARLEVQAFGLRFPNPIGVAAGVDKNAEILDLLFALGFGYVEIGTVTSAPQPGNPQPRVFRFPQDRALINRLGFPSQGAEVVAKRLAAFRARRPGAIVGVNIGKLKLADIEHAAEDYVKCFRPLRNLGDYFVVNVSSPNTPELRKLQEKSRLSHLLQTLQAENVANKPLLVKVAPDLNQAELADIVDVCRAQKISGIIATNTTLSRQGLSVETQEAGGLSGPPLRERALQIVRDISSLTQGKLPIIGVGGIETADDVRQMLQAGATLVQIYTGLVYAGPSLVRGIKRDFLAQ